MDTNKLKRFATEARTILMQGVKHRLQALGFDLKTGQPSEIPRQMEGGAVFMGDIVSTDFYNRWMSLHNNVQSRSLKEIAEEAAYTWFNRFMAIRIMAKQKFIAPVLEYESEDVRIPIIVSEARQGRIPQMKEDLRSRLMELLDDDSKTNEQFALLIVAYCHENPIINNCFGAITDYTELLLPQNILSDGGFVDMINHTEFITEEHYASAELIGWLYQFYISDRKDEAFAKKGKYDADEIAPATQIFTPNWIVKYMVENTLGRIYIDNNPYCDLKDELQYLVDMKPNTEILKVSDIADMKVADLACGSGHILNECFDMLYKIYIEEGYSRRSAIQEILSKNLVGIDIDTRAKQLATFALLMKACQKDQSFLDGNVMPRVYNMPRPYCEVIKKDYKDKTDEKAFICSKLVHFIMSEDKEMLNELAEAVMLIDHSNTLGSIMKFEVSSRTRNIIKIRLEEYEQQDFVPEEIQQILPYIRIILALTDRYAAICMNPPYMGSGRFDSTLSKYVKDNYPHSKADLFSVFMDVAIDRLLPNGKYGMINMHSWMFLSSFEELRRELLNNYHIDSLLHLGPRTFDELSGEVVQNAAFVISKYKSNEGGIYFRLINGKNCTDKKNMFLQALHDNSSKIYFSNVSQLNFKIIPECTIGYWISQKMIKHFAEDVSLEKIADLRSGISTGDNNRFYRLWSECNYKKISDSYNKTPFNSTYKWFKIIRGGSFRRWYGCCDNVINLENSCYEIKNSGLNHRLRTSAYYNKLGITWNRISSDLLGFRIKCKEFNFGENSPCMFIDDELDFYLLLGLLNTSCLGSILASLNPTLSNQVADLIKLPIDIKSIKDKSSFKKKVEENIFISKSDWDSHETSWDFETNPLLDVDESTYIDNINYEIEQHEKETGEHICIAPAAPQLGSLQWRMEQYKKKWEHLFKQLHENEEELNRQFINIYGLQYELTPDVPLSEITILQQGEIKIEDEANQVTDEGYNIVTEDNRCITLPIEPQIVWQDEVIIKQLISYAVGCMMGRYSIDKKGLVLANQGDGSKEFEELVPNSRFKVDDDGIIPLMSSDTDFADNATKRFKHWLAIAFGEDTLVENLNFIEGALKKSLTDYFVKDFWKDHKKMYQNRPIYWLFSSKKGAFQCITYMHRMNPYTAECIRTKYLLPHIEWLLHKQNEMKANSTNLSIGERKQLDNINKQIDECREYHDRLHVIADQQIAFDLDDGVVVNYAKFGDVLQKLK